MNLDTYLENRHRNTHTIVVPHGSHPSLSRYESRTNRVCRPFGSSRGARRIGICGLRKSGNRVMKLPALSQNLVWILRERPGSEHRARLSTSFATRIYQFPFPSTYNLFWYFHYLSLQPTISCLPTPLNTQMEWNIGLDMKNTKEHRPQASREIKASTKNTV